jgi:hypothetical protein
VNTIWTSFRATDRDAGQATEKGGIIDGSESEGIERKSILDSKVRR